MPGAVDKLFHSAFCFSAIAAVSLYAQLTSAQAEQQARQQTYAERIDLARPILVEAQAKAASLTPGSRALLLYRLGGAWYALDRDHAIRLYRMAFDAAKESDIRFRGSLERAIIVDLIAISPSDVLDLLPGAEPSDPTLEPDTDDTKRDAFYGLLIRHSVKQGNIALAMRAFDSGLSVGVLNERATAKLMAGLPRGANTERIRIFNVALDYYRAHPDSYPSVWSLRISDLIARSYTELPSQLVLQAIDMELEQAGKVKTNGNVGLGEDVTLSSAYDYQLFAVAPALRALDPSRAEGLLAHHDSVVKALKHYPQSVVSIDEKAASKGMLPKSGLEPQEILLFNGEGKTPELRPLDIGLEFTLPPEITRPKVIATGEFYAYPDTPEGKILHRTGACPADVALVLKGAEKVPVLQKMPSTCDGPLDHQWCSYVNTFPRAKLIQAVSERCTYGGDVARARQAIQAQIELSLQIPSEDRVAFLAVAADLYLRLDDRVEAAHAVELGFAAARAVFDDNLKEYQDHVSEGLWPAAESYRSMLALGVNSDLRATQAAVAAIPNSVLMEYERVMLARAMLGVPDRMSIIASPGSGFYRLESNPVSEAYK